MAFLGIQPFARMLITFDPAWLAVVRVRNSFCFVTLWSLGEWVQVFNTLGLAAFGLIMSKPNERRFFGSIFIVGVGGPILSLIGGDFLRNVLIVDIQAWRATWLLALVAHLFVAPMFSRVQRRGDPSFASATFLFTLGIGLFALSRYFAPLSIVAAVIIVAAGAVGSWEQLNNRAIPITAKVVVVLLVEVTLIVTVTFLYLSINDINHINIVTRPGVFTHPKRELVLTVIALSAIGVLLIGTTGSRKQNIRSAAILPMAIALGAVVGVLWDQRTPWTKFVDTTESPPDSLVSLLPGKSPIYWEDDVTVPSFL